MQKSAPLSMMTLTLFITGSIDSVRNLPSAAIFGTDMLYFFAFAAVTFLIPTGLIAAHLTSAWPEEGGIYRWVTKALGNRWGLVAVWLQWVNTMVWYPTMLSFIAATSAYLINPSWAHHRSYLVITMVSIFWLQTWINLRGLQSSARFASFCAAIGMVLPIAAILLMGAVWVAMGQPSHLVFQAHAGAPLWSRMDSWFALVAFIASFLGMELATVHVGQVSNAQRSFPRALLLSTLFIMLTMVFASLTIAVVLPHDQIHLVDGVMAVFHEFLSAFHLLWLQPLLAIALVVGSVGGMINWMVSPAKGLLQVAEQGWLPSWIAHRNRHGAPDRLLIAQALLVSMLAMAFCLLPSINASYWLLTEVSTQLYVLMYILMFVAAWCLNRRFPGIVGPFSLPGRYWGVRLVCLLGLLGCGACVFVGFIPPSDTHMAMSRYLPIFTLTMVVMILPVPLWFLRLKNSIIKFD